MKIKEITLKSSEELRVLESAVNFLNMRLFDNALSKIKITIQADTGTKNLSYGWASNGRWRKGEDKAHELNITANSIKRPFSEIWITLVHELIHIYAFCQGDEQGATSRQGRYHGKEFKRLCDKFYLITEKEKTIGYITPHQKMMKEQKALYTEFKKNCKADFSRLFKYERPLEEKIEKPKKPSKNSKYVCNECGIEFTALKGLKLICALCGEVIEEIPKD